MGSTGEMLRETLRQRGVTRRDFVKFCGTMAAVLALPVRYTPRIAEALEKARPVILWREFPDCAGNTESMLRSSHPDIASLVLESLSLDYHETLMAGAGRQAEAQIERVIREHKGKYIAVIEGAIPTADGGVYCTIGGRTAVDLAREDREYEAALRLCGETSRYALTGSIFAQSRAAVLQAETTLRFAAGNFYINDKPTGAVVVRQPFGGTRRSGTNDKAGSWLNLARWMSPRTIKETLNPPRSWPRAHMEPGDETGRR